MSGEKKDRLVPRLRFPEFWEAGGWDYLPLGKLAKRSIRKNTAGEVVRVLTNSAEYGVVDQRDFFDKDIANQGNLEGYYIVEKGDYVYNPRISSTAPVGPISRNNIGTGVMSPLYTVFRFNDDKSDFYAHYFRTSHWHQYMRQTSSTGARHDRMSIPIDDFMGLPLPAPSATEQHKIAACLSSLDERIAGEATKLDTLKAHKKGLMQQLFPAEGDTVPCLRFLEFQESGEWEEKRIGELKPFVTSGSRGWAAFYSNKGSLFVRMTNLTRESIYLDLADSKFVNLPPEATEGVRTQLKEYDVLISITADIGIIGYVDASVPSPAYINQHIALVRFNPSEVSSKFVSYFLASERSQRLFRTSTDTGTKAGMSLIGVQKIQVVLPALPEQQKIADCLSSLDDLINALAQKIALLKHHKKGLMQQLFPVLDEEPA
jgi:type I restriction enzyme S subunit